MNQHTVPDNIKHVSFDFWKTLFEQDKRYTQARDQYLASAYNPNNLTLEQINAICYEIKELADSMNMQFGDNFDSRKMIWIVLHKLGNIDIMPEDIDAVYSKLFELTLAFPTLPLAGEDGVHRLLESINKRGMSVSITSNTGFQTGEMLQRVIKEYGLGEYFSFYHWSDEVGMSKPNPKLFRAIPVALEHKASVHDILHIGDNPRSDVEGAEGVGMQAFLFNPRTKQYPNF